jgi:hypothetical protein
VLSPFSTTLRIDAQPAALDVLFDELSGGLSFQRLRSRSVHIPVGDHVAAVARFDTPRVDAGKDVEVGRTRHEPGTGSSLFEIHCPAGQTELLYRKGARAPWRRTPLAPGTEPVFVELTL